ncbi:hypothetical protein D3C75_921880 [compost metagenome]
MTGYFVDLIDKNNPRLLRTCHRFLNDIIHIDQLCRFILNQHFPGFPDRKLALLGPFGQQAAEHLLHIHAHLIIALACEHIQHSRRSVFYIDLDDVILQLASQQLELDSAAALAEASIFGIIFGIFSCIIVSAENHLKRIPL